MTGTELTESLQRHRKLLIALFVLVIVGLLGFFAYDKYQRHQLERAGVLYSELAESLAQGKNDMARASAETLVQSYPSTAYASMARFYLARLDIDAKQTAKAEAQLQRLVATDDLPTGMHGLARAALARLYLQQGKNQQVLQLLQKIDPAYTAIDWELRGDAQNALGKTQEALDDYRKATAALPATDPYLAYLQMKMANLGASG